MTTEDVKSTLHEESLDIITDMIRTQYDKLDRLRDFESRCKVTKNISNLLLARKKLLSK